MADRPQIARPILTFAALFLSALCLAGTADAQQRANLLFGSMDSASRQPAEAIGSYSKGCAAGLVELPETGPTWQAMRLSRNRNWGHPVAIDFIQDLSRYATTQGWRGLYIGDISQPRGGPMTSGHQSHQIGLDIDIWMKPADRLNLSRQRRENISSISVRSQDQRRLNGNWTRAHHEIIKRAAQDDRVDRIFVTAPVKIAMCQEATRRDRRWLQKVRPLFGHHYHFHVRLNCPRGDRSCETQTPTVRQLSNGGDGCDETLMWWVTDYLNPPATSERPADPPPRRRGARELTMADLPRQCSAVLSSN